MADDALDRLCRHFGLAATAARDAAVAAAGDAQPWYLRVAVAIGAWITAAAMILAVGTVLGAALPWDSLPVAAAVYGAVIMAVAIAVHRRRRGGFAAECAVAAALAGQALVVGSVAVEAESLILAALLAGGTTAILAILLRDAELLFLSSALTVVLVLAALLEDDTQQAGGVLLLVTLPPAMALLVRPPAALDLRGLAWALLLVPLAAQAIPESGWLNGGGLARVVYAMAMVAALALLARGSAPARRPMLLAAGAGAVLLGAVTAAGVLGSMLLLTLAYLLGNRPLAAVGAIAHAGFLGWFYHDLALDLLTKSWMLMVAGLLLLALWWLWSRRPAGGAGAGGTLTGGTLTEGTLTGGPADA